MVALLMIVAIICEAGWAIAMKMSKGFSLPGPSIATFILYILSVVFLNLATRRMDIGVGYAIWAGSGAALIAIAGVVYFKEPVTAIKVISLGLIVLGIVGLQLGESRRADTSPSAAIDSERR